MTPLRVTNDKDESVHCVPYVFPFVKEVHPNPVVRPGMHFRTSLSWFDTAFSKKKTRSVPFISKSGKFSAHQLMVWKCYPEQLLFSLVSTINSRLTRILSKRFDRVNRRLLNTAFKTSIVYAITHDDWVIDRFIGMARKGTPIKRIENQTHFCVCALDENKRFVYSQAYFQANWLKFQVFRPSDKSGNAVTLGSHLTKLVGSLRYDSNISGEFHLSCDIWNSYPVRKFGAGAHHVSGSESASVLSDQFDFKWETEDRLSFSSDDVEDY